MLHWHTHGLSAQYIYPGLSLLLQHLRDITLVVAQRLLVRHHNAGEVKRRLLEKLRKIGVRGRSRGIGGVGLLIECLLIGALLLRIAGVVAAERVGRIHHLCVRGAAGRVEVGKPGQIVRVADEVQR